MRGLRGLVELGPYVLVRFGTTLLVGALFLGLVSSRGAANLSLSPVAASARMDGVFVGAPGSRLQCSELPSGNVCLNIPGAPVPVTVEISVAYDDGLKPGATGAMTVTAGASSPLPLIIALSGEGTTSGDRDGLLVEVFDKPVAVKFSITASKENPHVIVVSAKHATKKTVVAQREVRIQVVADRFLGLDDLTWRRLETTAKLLGIPGVLAIVGGAFGLVAKRRKEEGKPRQVGFGSAAKKKASRDG